MARRGISKQEIFTTAKKLAAQGELPTAVKVRSLLATGSIATIQKYLKEWKTSCFNFNKDPINDLNATTTTHDLLESQRMLEQSLNQQIAKSENYAQELIQAEKTIVALKEENNKLQTTNQKLQLELKEVAAIKTILTQVNQEIQSRIELNNNQTIVQQQQLIVELQAELKELNDKSIKVMQELSSSSHEVLMQEKVNSINLQAKNELLMKELMERTKQLELLENQRQVQARLFKRQIHIQQQLLTNYLTTEELKNLSLAEVLTGASDGK